MDFDHLRIALDDALRALTDYENYQHTGWANAHMDRKRKILMDALTAVQTESDNVKGNLR